MLKFSVVIVFLLKIVLAIDTDCGPEPTSSDSYNAMYHFVKLDGVLIEFIRNSTDFQYGEFKQNCKNILKEGMKVRERYLTESKCLAEHEIHIKGDMLIDRVLLILNYWCSFSEEQQQNFFANGTLNCLKKIGIQLDDCVGYWNDTSSRDLCQTEQRKEVTECIHQQISEKCNQDDGLKVTKSLQDIFKFSEAKKLCSKDHGLIKYELVMLCLENDNFKSAESESTQSEEDNELSLDD